MNRNDLLSIGTFADAAQLSLKALRLYDQLGLLKPVYTDPSSSYRYYAVEQLRQARLIRMMRQMDMPLATIRLVLNATPAEAQALVREQWRMLQVRLEHARLTVQDLLVALEGEGAKMTISTREIEAKSVETQLILSVMERVKVEGLDAAILAGVRKLEALAGDKQTGAPFGIFHGVIDHESDGPVEICVPVRTRINGADVRELAGSRVACLRLSGAECDFPDVLKGYDAVADWIRQNGFKMAGSPREVWPELDRTGVNGIGAMHIEWPFAE